MRRLALTAVLAFCLGIAATLAFTGGGPGHAPPAAGRADSGPDPQPPAEEEWRRLRERSEKAEAENAALRAQVRALAEAAAPPPPGGHGGGSEPPRPESSAPRFVYAETAEALDAVDWDVLGESVAGLMPLLREAIDMVEGRKEMRAAFWGDLTSRLGPIVTEAVKLEQAGGEGLWNHPSVLVNLVHATLAQAGQPLTVAQAEELDALGLRFVEEDLRRRSAYPDSALGIAKRLDLVLLHDRFYAALAPLLTAEQHGVLHPEEVRGVVGADMFSGSIVWDEHYRKVKHADRAELAGRVLEGLRDAFEPGPASDAVLETLVAEWVAALPDAYVDAPPDAVRRSDDLERAERVVAAARHQIALYQALLARAPLTDVERRRVVEHDMVLVPLSRK